MKIAFFGGKATVESVEGIQIVKRSGDDIFFPRRFWVKKRPFHSEKKKLEKSGIHLNRKHVFFFPSSANVHAAQEVQISLFFFGRFRHFFFNCRRLRKSRLRRRSRFDSGGLG